MKPIHLNLAARPYRDYRPVYAAVVVMSLLTAFLMLNNIETYYRYVHETQSTRARIADLEAQARAERQREEAVTSRLKTIDVARLDAQTTFINAKLLERSFSWSVLLDQLESVLGDDVRLLSIGPSFRPDGGINLSLELESKSPEGMLRTINRMYEDPQFDNPFPSRESKIENGDYSFTLTVEYQPPNVQAAQKTRTRAEVRR